VKRTVFRNRWLPYLLVAPQVAITIVFFFWPAFDSVRLSLYRASPFGDRLIYVGLANFERLLSDGAYLRSAVTSFVFSFFVTFVGLALALLLAALANAKIRGLAVYRSCCGRTGSRRPSPASSGSSSFIRPMACCRTCFRS
jgi:sn-glycerol 3-phosphate transport system permease protein